MLLCLDYVCVGSSGGRGASHGVVVTAIDARYYCCLDNNVLFEYTLSIVGENPGYSNIC